ncbi:hypothetical protein [Novosphingobium sp. TH158]|uniref:hypothetical protein n=1 Tax=Novosphingobium sp. TH158 TaxID=2067455 RepID=UPI0020B12121|nr:hypothetical protein [Novosphingobium sp. TH158]
MGTNFSESALAESPAQSVAAPLVAAPTYADLADLADNAPLVLRARVKKVIPLDPAQASGLAPGKARVYVEAVTEHLFAGPAAVGEALRYLADLKLDARGRVPKLAKQQVLLFAAHVQGRPGEIQLVSPDAQIAWDSATEATLRQVLLELYAADAPGRVSGVQEAIHVPGTLAGEGETQIFLKTPDGEPASISVLHHAGMPTHWGVSFTEVVATTGVPPRRDSLTWYRLACFLPRELPAGVNVSASDADKAAAAADYRKVMSDLGDCPRTRQ